MSLLKTGSWLTQTAKEQGQNTKLTEKDQSLHGIFDRVAAGKLYG